MNQMRLLHSTMLLILFSATTIVAHAQITLTPTPTPTAIITMTPTIAPTATPTPVAVVSRSARYLSGFHNDKVRFNTFINSWVAYKNSKPGDPILVNTVSCSTTLGNILLGEKKEIKGHPLVIRPNPITVTHKNALLEVVFQVTGGTGGQITAGLISGENGSLSVTTETAKLTGSGLSIRLRLPRTTLTPEIIANDTRAFIYEETTTGRYEPVQEAAQRIAFTLTSAQFTLTGQPQLPDLAITASPTSTTIVSGHSLDVITTVTNVGSIPTTGTSAVRFYVDGKATTDTRSVPPLNPGATSTRTTPLLGLTTGTHTIKTVVDPTNAIAEITGANNVTTFTVTVVAAPITSSLPDLTVESISWRPTGFTPTEDVKIDFSVRNNGKTSSSLCVCSIQVDGQDRAFEALSPVLPNRASTITAVSLGDLTTGTHQITVIADSANNVAESNETNNVRTASITIAPASLLPDLVVESISWSPEAFAPTENVKIDFTVRNRGRTGSAVCACSIQVDGQSRAFQTLPPIGADDVSALTEASIGKLTLVPHQITVIVDPTNSVPECDESNNTSTITIRGPARTGREWSKY